MGENEAPLQRGLRLLYFLFTASIVFRENEAPLQRGLRLFSQYLKFFLLDNVRMKPRFRGDCDIFSQLTYCFTNLCENEAPLQRGLRLITKPSLTNHCS